MSDERRKEKKGKKKREREQNREESLGATREMAALCGR
jgi:hypothetical protein